ncbi:MAG: isochorismatase family protein [Nocardioidaceae bacterium]|nr:isochorismatase family protein [Nocardioidaceae bacterium]
MPEPWDHLLGERDRAVLAASGYGQSRKLRSPAAVLVIDLTFDFLGDRPEPILESVTRFPNSCGAEGWAAAERLAPVLAAARASDVPVLYTTRSTEHPVLEELTWGGKQTNAGRAAMGESAATGFPPAIAPQPGDTVIEKTKPSAFFDTPLRQYLVLLGIRQLFVAGATTSGCVRATVVDAFSHGFRTAVLADCVADRIEASHAIALFDLQAKYADLTDAATATGALGEGR